MALYGMIPSTTVSTFLKRLADGVYTGHPLLWKLTRGKKIRYEGGDPIVAPLIASAPSRGAFVAWEELVVGDNDIDSARYSPVSYYAAVGISGQDYYKNKGSSRMLDLFGAKMANAELGIRDSMATDMFVASGSEAANTLTSIDTIVNEGAVTLGGLTSTDVVLWAGQNVDQAGAAFDLDDLETLYVACTEDMEQPDIGVTNAVGYQSLWSSMQANQRFVTQGDAKMAAAGFESLKFNRAAVVMDKHISTATATGTPAFTGNRFYLLNTKYLQLCVHPDVEFVMEEKAPSNQWAYLAYIYWLGQLVCNNRRFQGVYHDFVTFAP